MRDPRDPRLVAFGERLARLRRARLATQEALAAGASLSGKYVSEVERGEANPSLLVLSALAAALGVPMAVLVGEDSPATPAALAAISAELAGKSAGDCERALLLIRALFVPLR